VIVKQVLGGDIKKKARNAKNIMTEEKRLRSKANEVGNGEGGSCVKGKSGALRNKEQPKGEKLAFGRTEKRGGAQTINHPKAGDGGRPA